MTTAALSGADNQAGTKVGAECPFLVRLHECAEAIETGHQEVAEAMLGWLLECVSAEGTAEERVTHWFARSLQARLSGEVSGTGNLYQEGENPGDMLAAFQVLVEATPFVRFAYLSCNRLLAGALEDAPRIHLIDIGIGSGTQWFPFLEVLAARPGGPPHLRLTGVEVPAPGVPKRLDQVGAALAARAEELGVPFSFEPISALVETLEPADFRVRADEVLAINAVLALHHVPEAEPDGPPIPDRNAVLRRLCGLRPRILTLVEPDSEHHALPFLPRLSESFVHYLTVFDALASLLDGHGRERAVLERAFFGRELRNIVIGEGAGRIERHERHQSWQRRLSRAGFVALDCTGLADTLRTDLAIRDPFALALDQGALLLAWKQIPLLAVSAWTPGADC
jgi:hypothetical protein